MAAVDIHSKSHVFVVLISTCLYIWCSQNWMVNATNISLFFFHLHILIVSFALLARRLDSDRIVAGARCSKESHCG